MPLSLWVLLLVTVIWEEAGLGERIGICQVSPSRGLGTGLRSDRQGCQTCPPSWRRQAAPAQPQSSVPKSRSACRGVPSRHAGREGRVPPAVEPAVCAGKVTEPSAKDTRHTASQHPPMCHGTWMAL